MGNLECPYCHNVYSPDFLKDHIRYRCRLNPQRDIRLLRKKVIEMREKMKADDDYHKGWDDALNWILIVG